MTTAQLEIEKKFFFDESFEAKLISVGATRIGEKTFTDEYLDSEDFTLSKRDIWLRFRNSKPELKCGDSSLSNRKKSISEYIEYEGEETIYEVLFPILYKEKQIKVDTGDGDNLMIPRKIPDKLNILLFASQCKPFAEFQTKRTSFHWKNCRFDLDETDFGFNVGEIEKIVELGQDRDSVYKEFIELGELLDIKMTEEVPSKIETYLRKCKPDLFHALVSADIFSGRLKQS